MQTCVVHYTCHSFEKWNEIQDYHSYKVYFLTIAKRSQLKDTIHYKKAQLIPINARLTNFILFLC